jgi:hypothetical protein
MAPADMARKTSKLQTCPLVFATDNSQVSRQKKGGKMKLGKHDEMLLSKSQQNLLEFAYVCFSAFLKKRQLENMPAF